MHYNPISTKPSALTSLREIVPQHEIGFQHALKVVEKQTDLLLHRFYGDADLSQILESVPNEIASRFSRVKIIYTDPEDLETSGASRWNGSQWVIFLRKTDSHVRQRFTMMHELAHVIHHRSLDLHFTGKRFLTDQPDPVNAAKQRERAADHFAGCLLMPRSRMFTLWTNGVRDPKDLATQFDVSQAAVAVRLEQLGLVRPRWMCTRGLKEPTTPTRAFNAATEETMRKIRTLGLREGQPLMRDRYRRRTLHNPHLTARRAR